MKIIVDGAACAGATFDCHALPFYEYRKKRTCFVVANVDVYRARFGVKVKSRAGNRVDWRLWFRVDRFVYFVNCVIIAAQHQADGGRTQKRCKKCQSSHFFHQ